VDDLGAPIAYLVARRGVPVFGPDGERLGTLDHVLAEPGVDVFDGLIVDTSALPGGRRFADADDVDELFENGVVLKVGAEGLREITEAQARDAQGPVQQRLQRAWDWVSGNRR
jgi:hypothetical protein